jgi:hypothetical protein
VVGRQPWISIYFITGCGIDILSLNIQQECIHSLTVVEKRYYYPFDNKREKHEDLSIVSLLRDLILYKCGENLLFERSEFQIKL